MKCKCGHEKADHSCRPSCIGNKINPCHVKCACEEFEADTDFSVTEAHEPHKLKDGKFNSSKSDLYQENLCKHGDEHSGSPCLRCGYENPEIHSQDNTSVGITEPVVRYPQNDGLVVMGPGTTPDTAESWLNQEQIEAYKKILDQLT